MSGDMVGLFAHVNSFISGFMMPMMLMVFVLAILARLGIYITIRGEKKFTREFEHRVERYINGELTDVPRGLSFHALCKKLLDKTFFEHYRLRAERRRRRFDTTETIMDRVFGVEKGSQRLIDDTLRQTRYHAAGQEPNFDRVSKYVFNSNPYFNRLLGVFKSQSVDNVLNVLPGMFIICGILGTFVGVIQGIPALRAMDVTNLQSANGTMGQFLDNMGFAMTSSVLGMILSLLTTMANTIFSPYGMYLELVDTYKSALSFAWRETHGGFVDEAMEPSGDEKLPGTRRAEDRAPLATGDSASPNGAMLKKDSVIIEQDLSSKYPKVG